MMAPGLLAAHLLATGLVGPSPVPAAGETARGPSPGGAAAHLLQRLNDERRDRGLPGMTWNPILAELARRHASELQRRGELSHQSAADGAAYADRLARTDLRARRAAENLARAPDPEEAHQGLMASPGHRGNILDPDLEEVGIGVAAPSRGGDLFVVQDFAALMPDLDDAEASRALAEALRAAWGTTGTGLERDAALERRAQEALAGMIRRDRVDTSGLRVEGPAWVFAYTSTDPAALPADVRAQAGQGRRFGLAVSFRRTPSTPLGLYWIALILGVPRVAP